MTHAHANAHTRTHTHLSRALKCSTHLDVAQIGATLMWHVKYMHVLSSAKACSLSNWIHACSAHLYGTVIYIHMKNTQQHKHTILWYASISREGKSPKQGRRRAGKNNYRSSETVERSTVFCGMSVGLTAPEERSRDHVCSATVRQEGFEKGSALITGKHTDSTWKRGACAPIHRPPSPQDFCSP